MSVRAQVDADRIPNTVTYNVFYKVWETAPVSGERFLDITTQGPARVTIGETSSHVTTFGDIPRIIAVSRGLKAEDVLVTVADVVAIVDENGHRL